MSKLIVEMEMPKDLAVIVTILPDGRIFKHLGYKDKKQIGKIVGVLPDEHGDLIDRDVVIKEFEPYAGYESNRSNAEWVERINVVLNFMTAVIAAERKADEQTGSNTPS